MTIPVNSGDIYTDVSSLRNLKRDAAQGSPEALKKTAEQFEALFLQMMLKSMRQSSSGEGMFESDQTRFYQQMFDQQIAIDMAKKRQLGIADLLVNQLGRDDNQDVKPLNLSKIDVERLRASKFTMEKSAVAPLSTSVSKPVSPKTEDTPPPTPQLPIRSSISLGAIERIVTSKFDSPGDFIGKLTPLAEKYGAELGVDPKILLAQAALETGWGKKISRGSNGESSHNLFNIKADKRWLGEEVVVSTLEYERNLPVQQLASFRAYQNFEDSFKDYVGFLKSNPRYQKALEKAGDGTAFIRSLHEAGYATDPKYSTKITTIMRSDLFNGISQQM